MILGLLKKEVAAEKKGSLGVIVGVMGSDNTDEKTRDDSFFDWLSVSSVVCRLIIDRYLDNVLTMIPKKKVLHLMNIKIVLVCLTIC